MKLGDVCSPISGGSSMMMCETSVPNVKIESSVTKRMPMMMKKSTVDTGLTGEFIGIKLESPTSSFSTNPDRRSAATTLLSPLTTTTATTATTVDDIDQSLAIRDDAKRHVDVDKQQKENSDASERLTDANPLVRAHRRRFEMLKCSSAHNILKAPIVFVNKNNARISLSPIRSSYGNGNTNDDDNNMNQNNNNNDKPDSTVDVGDPDGRLS